MSTTVDASYNVLGDLEFDFALCHGYCPYRAFTTA